MKANFIYAILIILGWGFIQSCSTKAKHQETVIKKVDEPEGLVLLNKNCISCHSPDANFDNRLAPPMVAIKKHYITEGVSKQQFVSSIHDFVKQPSADKSKMPNAVKRFGLMPALAMSDDELQKIAEYIFETDIEAPSWFEKHYQQEKKNHEINGINYMSIGQEHALATKAVLGKNLFEAINSKGTEGALDFCNIKAMPLTDSMSTVRQVQIKRVSDKPRNPKNEANKTELAYIEKAKIEMTQGKIAQPQVIEKKNKIIGYYPIETNKMCVKCHGNPTTDINAATLKKIENYYPKDKAKGYAENQLRGIWVVEMMKK